MTDNDISKVFYTNLVLLGFDSAAEQVKHRIPFNSCMFDVPNTTAFQVVFHFLFSKLDPNKTKECFRDCWPITDKKQEQEFRHQCFTWLTHLSKEDETFSPPHLSPSHFMTPCGMRFYHIALVLSNYVLRKTITTTFGLKDYELLRPPSPRFTKVQMSLASEGLMRMTVIHTNKFLAHQQTMQDVHSTCSQYARDLCEENQRVNQEIREKEKILQQLLNYSCFESPKTGDTSTKRNELRSPKTGDTSNYVENRLKRKEKVRELWKELDIIYCNQQHSMNVVESIIDGSVNKYVIDGSKLDVKVSDQLLKNYIKKTKEKKIELDDSDGNFNLLSFIQLFKFSLSIYYEKLHEVELHKFQLPNSILADQITRHDDLSSNLTKLRSCLVNKLLPELETSVLSLKNQLKSPTIYQNQPGNLDFELVLPTPPQRFYEDSCSLRNSAYYSPSVFYPEGTPEGTNCPMNSLRWTAKPSGFLHFDFSGDVSKKYNFRHLPSLPVPQILLKSFSQRSTNNSSLGSQQRISTNSSPVTFSLSFHTPELPFSKSFESCNFHPIVCQSTTKEQMFTPVSWNHQILCDKIVSCVVTNHCLSGETSSPECDSPDLFMKDPLRKSGSNMVYSPDQDLISCSNRQSSNVDNSVHELLASITFPNECLSPVISSHKDQMTSFDGLETTKVSDDDRKPDCDDVIERYRRLKARLNNSDTPIGKERPLVEDSSQILIASYPSSCNIQTPSPQPHHLPFRLDLSDTSLLDLCESLSPKWLTTETVDPCTNSYPCSASKQFNSNNREDVEYQERPKTICEDIIQRHLF